MVLPLLPLSKFIHGNEAQRKAFAQNLVDSFKQHGFVKIVDHGISDNDIEETFAWFRAFFSLPVEQRMEVLNPPGPNPQRGWSTLGAESTASLYTKGLLGKEVKKNLKDAREHWDQGSSHDYDYPNRWLAEEVLPGFRDHMEARFERMEAISNALMSALEIGLNLPKGSFTERITHENNASEFRCNHYPAVDIADIRKGELSRIWPHFDLGVITLLFQDQVGGLEFENRASPGDFYQVECGSPSDIVVNVSETLQRWTNGFLPAGLHRVTPPPAMHNMETGMLPARYSVAYFTKADRSASVRPLSKYIPQGKECDFKEMTALEYHSTRLLSAY